MKKAIQLYTLREHTANDFIGTVKKVSEMGYEGVEFAGYGNLKANEMKQLLGDLNLSPVSSHLGLDVFENNFDYISEYNLAIGLDNVTIPYMGEDMWGTYDLCMKTCERMQIVAEKLKKLNSKLSYHNHSMEFGMVNNKYILDIFLENTPDLYLELDTCWSQSSGVDSPEYIKKWKDKICFLHIKDYKQNATPFTQIVGTGELPLEQILKTGIKYGVEWAILEQDEFQIDQFEGIRLGLQNMKKYI